MSKQSPLYQNPVNIPPYEDSKSGSPKKMKTLMSGDVSQADLTITTLMQDSGSSHQSKPFSEFKFWSNNFDGLRYIYDPLNATEDIEKVKSIGSQRLTQNLEPTWLRCAVMTRGLFEEGDAFEKNEVLLTKDITQLKDDLKVHTAKLEELTKKLSKMKKNKETSESHLSEMTKPKEIVESKCSELEATDADLD